MAFRIVGDTCFAGLFDGGVSELTELSQVAASVKAGRQAAV